MYARHPHPFLKNGDVYSDMETAMVQATAKTSMAPLRAIQHKDALGNPIGKLVTPLLNSVDEVPTFCP
jgi:hypothetical protein